MSREQFTPERIRRFARPKDGALQRFIVALNFSDEHRVVDIPFPANGTWKDLVTDTDVQVSGFWRRNALVESNWGHVYVL